MINTKFFYIKTINKHILILIINNIMNDNLILNKSVIKFIRARVENYKVMKLNLKKKL